jgi:two-component system LytT family response regulator
MSRTATRIEPITTILVDDDPGSLGNLEHLIRKFCLELRVIAATGQPAEAIVRIRRYNPEVIFLNIEMPQMNGFRLLSELGDYEAEIIFTAAYDHYSIEALRASAFDYLLKPIPVRDLRESVARLIRRIRG